MPSLIANDWRSSTTRSCSIVTLWLNRPSPTEHKQAGKRKRSLLLLNALTLSLHSRLLFSFHAGCGAYKMYLPFQRRFFHNVSLQCITWRCNYMIWTLKNCLQGLVLFLGAWVSVLIKLSNIKQPPSANNDVIISSNVSLWTLSYARSVKIIETWSRLLIFLSIQIVMMLYSFITIVLVRNHQN